MAFQYASYAIPQSGPSSLAAFLPAFEAGQQKRADEQANEALASLFAPRGPYQQPPQSQVGTQAAGSAAIPSSYIDSVIQSESGGNPNAKNPNSSATGLGQFIDSTWQGIMRAHPELGLTPDGRTDPAQAKRALQAFTLDNAKVLASNGIQPSPGSLYAAHFLGPGGAVKVLSAPDDAPVASLVPGAASANSGIANMTVGQFKAWAAQQGGGANNGYVPPTIAANGSPAAVGDRAAELAQFQALGAPDATGGATAAPAGAPTIQMAQNGLPDRATMLALLRSSNTRPLAIDMIKTVQAGRDPTTLLKRKLLEAQIAEANAKANGGADPATVREYQFAQSQGFKGSLLDYLNAKKGGGLSVTTNPDGTVSIQQGGAQKLTEGQSKDVGFYTRGLEANQQLATLDNQLTDFSQAQLAPLAPLGLGNYAKTPQFRQAKVAADQFLATILRKDSGAAITEGEFNLYGPMFLPVPGDDAGTIAQKRRMRDVALLAIKSGLGTAQAIGEANRIVLGSPDPAAALQGQSGNEQPAQPKTQADYDALPSGATFIDPEDGKTYRKP